MPDPITARLEAATRAKAVQERVSRLLAFLPSLRPDNEEPDASLDAQILSIASACVALASADPVLAMTTAYQGALGTLLANVIEQTRNAAEGEGETLQ